MSGRGAYLALVLQAAVAVLVPLAETGHDHRDHGIEWHAQNDACEHSDPLAECALLRTSLTPAIPSDLGVPERSTRPHRMALPSALDATAPPRALTEVLPRAPPGA